jgi:hypothetical protein
MLLATIGTNKNLCTSVSELSILASGHILDTFINEVEVDFVTSGESGLGQSVNRRSAGMRWRQS